MWTLWVRFQEKVERKRHRIDFAGATLLGAGGTLLLLALLEGGVQWAWDSGASIGLFVAAVVLLATFVVVERRAAEPVLPLWVFKMRVLNVANAGSLIVGVLMLGLSSYVPLYSQKVLGSGAVVAGLVLAAMTIGWPIAASNAGRLYLTLGFRFTTLLGAVIALVGAGILTTVNGDSSLWHLAGACFVMGLGFGFVASPGVVAAQSAVSWAQRGVATGANMFARSVGSAVGVAVFGAIVNSHVSARLGSGSVNLEHVSSAVLEPAIHDVYVLSLAIAVLLVVFAVFMPQRVVEPSASTAPSEPAAEPEPDVVT
jgi:MFS family permease